MQWMLQRFIIYDDEFYAGLPSISTLRVHQNLILMEDIEQLHQFTQPVIHLLISSLLVLTLVTIVTMIITSIYLRIKPMKLLRHEKH